MTAGCASSSIPFDYIIPPYPRPVGLLRMKQASDISNFAAETASRKNSPQEDAVIPATISLQQKLLSSPVPAGHGGDKASAAAS